MMAGRGHGDAAPLAAPDRWIRTTSPEESIHLCKTSFYPHQLKLLGPSRNFGLVHRVTRVGPITVGDITYRTDVALGFDDALGSYHINVPLNGWLESRHRGVQMSPSPAMASIYRPDGEIAVTRWPGGTRNVAVKIDQVALERALESLVDGPVDSPIPFTAELPLKGDAAQSWVRLLLMVQRHLDGPDSVLRHSVVSVPLVESLIHGFLLVAEHPYRETLAAPAKPGRPAAVRQAMDIIEARAHLPLSTSALAQQCHISVRTLQEGFRRHLGMSPMAYVRVVRLRHAHRDLRSADPTDNTVAAIAHRWGFTHLGRFAAAHKATYGDTPTETLRALRTRTCQ